MFASSLRAGGLCLPTYVRRLSCERLEDRIVLAGAAENNVLQLFSSSAALFVENQGQWADESVRYAFDGDAANITFTTTGLEFLLTERQAVAETQGGLARGDQAHALRDDPFQKPEKYSARNTHFSVRFEGADNVTPVGLQEVESRFNYLVGNETDWRTGVMAYEVVAYQGLYPGIDLHTFGQLSSLKYEFHVAAGADYRQIRVRYDGIDGLWLDEKGALHVQTELGEMVDSAPYVYQVIDGQQVEVDASFELVDAHSYTFEIRGPYDSSVELVIDPELAWSTYLGGSGGARFSGFDGGNGVAVDAAGNVLVTGWTETRDFATTGGAFDRSRGGNGDAFVTKLTSSGSLMWSTYLGGSDGPHSDFGGMEQGTDIAVDAGGNVLVTGKTASRDFPTTAGAFDRSLGGHEDAFVAKLSSGGRLDWSTYLGGSDGPHSNFGGSDGAGGIAVDAGGNVLVTGKTASRDFPTTAGAFDRSLGGYEDAFVAKLTSSGSLMWSTYLGGTDGPQSNFGGMEDGADIAIDAAGNVLVTGRTDSNNFPTTAGAFDRSLGGYEDAFVTKLTSNGSLSWSTYLGGSDGPHSDFGGSDFAAGIAVDSAGNVLVTGSTGSGDFPTTSNAFDRSLGGDEDAFVTKLTSGGSVSWSTYLGGSDGPHSDFGGRDNGAGIAVDGAGNVLVTGATYSGDFPIIAGAFSDRLGGRQDAFVTKLTRDGRPFWSTYFGGSGDGEVGFGIAVDVAGDVLVTGSTESYDFPTNFEAFDWNLGGGTDAFVAKIFIDGNPAWSTYLGGSDGPGSDYGSWDSSAGIAVDTAGNVFITGTTFSNTFPTSAGVFDRSMGSLQDAFVTKLTSSGNLAWSTYLGGSEGPHSNFGGWDSGADIAVDATGNVLVTGSTASIDFPTTAGAFDRSLGGYEDAFVTKLTSSGGLSWSTYVGGSQGPHSDFGGMDDATGMAVDAVGNVLVTGSTGSGDFPTTTGAFDRSLGGDIDAFVTKLTSGGRLAWSTYLGGSPNSGYGGVELGTSIAVDAEGNVLATGSTASDDFPTTAGALDRNLGGYEDAFVTKLTSGGSLDWSTYLGGSHGPQSDLGGGEAALGITVDAAGNVLLAGATMSDDFPTTSGAFDRSLGGDSDAFVTKLSRGGSLAWSTYLGGSDGPHSDFGGGETAVSIAVDAAGNVLVTGSTLSRNFPTTAGAFDRSLGGYNDAFVTKLTSSGRLAWSNYLGGSDGPHSVSGGSDAGSDVAVASACNVLVTGWTWSQGFPTTVGAFDRSLGGDTDAFVAKILIRDPGDANLDGIVDAQDFNIWNTNKFTGNATWSMADFNADRVVDLGDYSLWNENKFTQPSPGRITFLNPRIPRAAMQREVIVALDSLVGDIRIETPNRHMGDVAETIEVAEYLNNGHTLSLAIQLLRRDSDSRFCRAARLIATHSSATSRAFEELFVKEDTTGVGSLFRRGACTKPR